MLSGRPAAAADGDMRLVAVPEKQTLALPPRPPAAGSNALVEYTPPVPNPEEEDLECLHDWYDLWANSCSSDEEISHSHFRSTSCISYFLRVPFPQNPLHELCDVCSEETHARLLKKSFPAAVKWGITEKMICHYRQMRRKEQDRLARMDADYQKRQELAEFNKKRDERVKAAEERTAKNRLKRQKKKQRKKVKKSKLNAGGEEHQTEAASDDDGDSDNDEEAEV
ncbi:hypothetical protein RHGRI_032627 [Rhododendron griersonianum]|uniref:PRKR-interacting protein 1 n=1 Tax=Rhododendron griersonianum TaxID=479676 RepID=A0AAV6IFR2_9ERIC|nr:hypothetical protein RHGRI_032627 [Rhododendron griersonianum]